MTCSMTQRNRAMPVLNSLSRAPARRPRPDRQEFRFSCGSAERYAAEFTCLWACAPVPPGQPLGRTGTEHLVFDLRFKFDRWFDQIELLGKEVISRFRS